MCDARVAPRLIDDAAFDELFAHDAYVTTRQVRSVVCVPLLSHGAVAAEGTPAEVMREEVLREVYGWPISVHTDPRSGAPRVTPLRSNAGFNGA